jgi:imidazole glycerol-phosphate synthase subunit HisH
MIGIVDYGMGNIKSVENAVLFCDKSANVVLVKQPEELKNCSKIILPGVGAFEDAISSIKQKGFYDAIHAEVKKGKYLLGICLGMQLLASKSYEFGEFEGLGLIEGEVIGFRNKIPDQMRVPHIGWNNVGFRTENPLFNNIENQSDFYFVHSFYFDCKNSEYILATTNYGVDFTSVVARDNVFGAQFHPEKSQQNGLQFIKNFLNLK